jgi:hypothetical protein
MRHPSARRRRDGSTVCSDSLVSPHGPIMDFTAKEM